MPQYLAVYLATAGDEDPASNQHFSAKDDAAAKTRMAEWGRPGDNWELYRKVGHVSHNKKEGK